MAVVSELGKKYERELEQILAGNDKFEIYRNLNTFYLLNRSCIN